MLFNLLEAAAEVAEETATTQKSWSMYIIIGVIAVAFIGITIWQNFNNKKKAKEAEETVKRLQPGDKVKTIGGVCGFLVEMNEEENTFVIETGTLDKKSYLKFDMSALWQSNPTGEVPVEEKAPESQPVEEETVSKKDKKKNKKKNKKEETVEVAENSEEAVTVDEVATEVKEEIKEEVAEDKAE